MRGSGLARRAHRRASQCSSSGPQLIVMVAEPDSVRDPNRALMIGVSGTSFAVTRTEMTLPAAWNEQVVPVQAPVGGVPAGGARTHAISAAETLPNGAIIRLAAVVTWASSVVSLPGQTGPPPVPHAGSALPR